MPEADNTFKLIVENAYSDASAQGDPSSLGKQGTNSAEKKGATQRSSESTGHPESYMKKLNTSMAKFLKRENEGEAEKQGGNVIKGALKATGIQLTLGNLLKQSQIFTGVLNAVFSVIGAIFDIILAPFMPMIASFLEETIPVLIDFAYKIGEFLSGELADLAEMGIVDYFKDRIEKIWEWAVNELPELVKKVWDWFQSNVTNKIPEWLGFAAEALETAWTWIAENIPGFLEKAWDWIEEYWPTILQYIIDFVSSAWDAVKGYIADLIRSIPGFLAGLLYMLADFYDKFGPMIAEGLGWLINTIITMFPKLIEAIINGVAWVISDVIGRGLAGLARFLGETISKAIMGVVRWITGFLGDISITTPWGAEWKPFESIAAGMEEMSSWVVGEDGLLNMGVDAIAGMWTGLTEGVAGLLHMNADIMGSDMVTAMFDWAGNVSDDLVTSMVGGIYGSGAEGIRSLAAGLETEGTQSTFDSFGDNIANLNIDVTVNGSKQQEQSAQLDKHNKKIQVEVMNDIGMQMLSASDQPVHYNQSTGLFNNW